MDHKFQGQNPDVGYMITNISYAIRQYFGNLFSEYGITYPQSRVLTRLFAQMGKGDVNQRDLEHALGIKASLRPPASVPLCAIWSRRGSSIPNVCPRTPGTSGSF